MFKLAIRTHLANPPYSVACDSEAHVYKWESSGISFHTGASVIPIKAASTFLTEKDVMDHIILDEDIHTAPTKLICLENTLNGLINPLGNIKLMHISISNFRGISSLAKKNGVPIHLDGARLFNASVKSGITINEYCRYFDSASLCLSKGLGAPVGSIITGLRIEHFI